MMMYAYLTMSSDVVLILSGATMFWLSPLLRRNWVLGYGSARSMINDETWRAGNRFAGLTLAMLTLIAMLLQVSLWEAIESSEVGQAASAVSTFSLPLLVMFLTEKYLARTFRN
jgi:uncharacterized membrane protein